MRRGTEADFGQGGGPEIRLPLVLPASKALLWINGGVFLLSLALRWLIDLFALSPLQWRFPWLPVWQLLTYGFLHSPQDPFHLLYNLLGIYFFGSMLEGIVGSRRYLAWYLAAIVFGGVVQLADGLIAAAGGNPVGYTLGASGGVLFLIVACATLRPDALVIFILFPMRLKTLALILVGIDVFRLLVPEGGGTAYLVHLAGAALGFGAAKLRWIWIDPLEKLEEQRAAAVQRGAEDDARRLDQLLAQIHQRGIGSLSKSERDFLKRMSSRK